MSFILKLPLFLCYVTWCPQVHIIWEFARGWRWKGDSHFVVQEHVGKKRNLMEVPHKRPEEQLVKRRRSETGEKDVETIKPESNVEASSTVTRRVGEENPLKRKCMDVSQGPESRPEATGKRRRTETEENYKKTKDIFLKCYAVGRMLGHGGCASVCAGVRRSDGIKVALKIMSKIINDKYITVLGDTRRLPAEVAILELVCKPPRCPYVIELLDWIGTPAGIIIVLDRPDHCVDLFEFCRRVNLTENMAKIIMQQVIQAARHCRARGVFHRDIKEKIFSSTLTPLKSSSLILAVVIYIKTLPTLNMQALRFTSLLNG
ncbi:serine/threonine-protein kinase PSK1-like [Tachysurus fulvidraco]|uniref:serine/threonine-protein kinase PSK1-like n=1 Tax=Tachysurus fulvidraco TaxID=1234273 RepID=UPI001FEF2CCE|nr:serine/threonine-protein kinase PSK1-like [Tachysurus fulvidraco]